MITARIVCDSVSLRGDRLTTIELCYPRFIHAEFMTHRVFSRNAGSSRAIPVKKQLAGIRRTPAEPIHWGANQKGMQAHEELKGIRRWLVRQLWKRHRRQSTRTAWLMDKLGAHKQIVNRIVEPHNHITVLVSSTCWANFFALRYHVDAMPEIRELAHEMQLAMDYSTPDLLSDGEWHLPYITVDERANEKIGLATLLNVSVARCARVSYRLFDGRQTLIGLDVKLAEKLLGSKPLHASPAEHQATPDTGMKNPNMWGNFHGWIQWRKSLPDEYVEDESYDLKIARPADPSTTRSDNKVLATSRMRALNKKG